MYDVVYQIIGNSSVDPQVVCDICGALIIIMTSIFVDLVYRVIGHFWR